VGTRKGLIGMRERIELFGGRFEAGPLPDGGFRVYAQLPIVGPPPKS
jgi:signal transduction histidine kinase